MAKMLDWYQESRDVWQDCNHRQEFEHELINRKTSWWLTGQSILLAAYGLTLRSDFVDKSNEFRNVVALSGFAMAVVTLGGVLALIRSKRLSWRQYKEFYSSKELPLPRQLNEKTAPVGRQH